MNNHINRNKPTSTVDSIIQPLVRDTMPPEVATDLLCQSKRMCNCQRKTCMDARSKVFISTRVAKTPEVQLAARLKSAKWVQLCRWLGRLVARRKDIQAKIGIAQRRHGKESVSEKERLALRQLVARLNLIGTTIESEIDGLETEIDRRRAFIESVRAVAPSVATGMETAMAKGE